MYVIVVLTYMEESSVNGPGDKYLNGRVPRSQIISPGDADRVL